MVAVLSPWNAEKIRIALICTAIVSNHAASSDARLSAVSRSNEVDHKETASILATNAPTTKTL